MTRDETVALYLKCCEAWDKTYEICTGLGRYDALDMAAMDAKAVWNAWADGVLSQRKELEAGRRWYEVACADFRGCVFVHRGNGKSQIRLDEQKKADTETSELVTIEVERISFYGFRFPGTANFWGVTFEDYAEFYNTEFCENALFRDVTFSGGVSFYGATFQPDPGTAAGKTPQFNNATFLGTALFRETRFNGNAEFLSSAFNGDANFDRAVFTGAAFYESVHFQKSTNFANAKFLNVAKFSGIKVDRAFDMPGAQSSIVPAFNQADFKQAPDLDDVDFPIPGPWPWHSDKKPLIAQYRAIRRMAIQGADYENEWKAFKGELRSRRWAVDKFWHPGLWLGLFYDGVADCGRSIWRPAVTLLASVFVFAIAYVRLSEGWTCNTPFLKSVYVSGRNALVLFSGGRDARISQAYECLYGGTDAEPQIPDSVSFLESFVQVPLSATLIFLFLLAVKNRFKIK